MKKNRRWIVFGALALVLAAVAALGWVKREYIEELPIGCAFKAKTLCAGVFVQGLPAATVEREDAAFDPAFGLMKAAIDTAHKSVTCSIFGLGLFARTAVYIEGLGPVLLSGKSEKAIRSMAPPPVPDRPAGAAPAVDRSAIGWPDGDREPSAPEPKLDSGALKAAMDGVFVETDPVHLKRTRAVIVVYRGRIVAERYADGISKDIALLSWSMAKSFTNALAGILVRQGKLDIKAPAPVPEWKKPGDPRGAITTDMLMRMSSGLAWEEDYTDHPVSDVNRMLFLEPDMAAFAASKRLAAAPDSRWSYSSGSTNIVSRIVRATVGDEAAYLAFPRRELFDKIGMSDVVFGVDASGTLIGSSYLYATARDYARFGLLCLGDGTWKGERILPEGWMAYSTTPTGGAPKGEYGAFFWLNKGGPGKPSDRELPGMPTDLYWADGYQGQQIFVCPSLDLVAVRLGMTWNSSWGARAFLDGIRKAIRR